MCVQLVKAFEELRDFAYIPKTKGRTVEAEIAQVIATRLSCQIVEKPPATGAKGSLTKTGERYYAQLRTLVKPYIILQPEGTQNAPDIRLVMPERELDIECKRSEKGQIMWNSGRPKTKNIYILNSKSKNLARGDTTFCLGSAVIDLETEILLETMLDDFNKLKKSINSGKLKNSMFELQHIRPMYKERDSAYWLEHSARRKRELDVLQLMQNIN